MRKLMAEIRDDVRRVEDHLISEGISVFPATASGDRARLLLLKIKPRLHRGAAVELTNSALKFGWHREQLRRARTVLVGMGLIKPALDGRFVCASPSPLARIDDLIREDFFNLRMLLEVAEAVSLITGKSKTQQRRSVSLASQPEHEG
jgi:hypothetical protein